MLQWTLGYMCLLLFLDFWWRPFCPVCDDTSLWFDLHFSKNEWGWTSLQVFISHLYVFFGEMSVYVFSPLFDWVVFLSLSCMCLYILEINLLSVVSFTIIFSHSESFLFTLFIVSFAVQKLLSLIRFHLFILFLFPLF